MSPCRPSSARRPVKLSGVKSVAQEEMPGSDRRGSVVDPLWVLRRGLPDLILAVTNPLAFDAPQIPSEAEVVSQANAGSGALKTLLDGFRGDPQGQHTPLALSAR